MKRTIFISLLMVLVLCGAAPFAEADGEPVVITPYYDGPTYYVAAGSEVIIRAGWGTCTRGLAEAFRHASSLSMEIERDGAPWLTLEPPNREYWTSPAPSDGDPSACVMMTGNGWQTEWFYSLGIVDIGEYDGYFLWTLTHPLPDGGDYDGDGQIDIFSGVIKETDFTIIVE